MTDRAGEGSPRITGVVRSFMPERGFGFIRGNDGRDYFVHRKSVAGGELVDGQQVEFDGMPGPKGYKAVSVIPGDLPLEPGQAYESPNRFIWTQDAEPRGFQVIFTLGNGWSESNNPHEARAGLERICQERGGNAVLNVRLEKSSRQQGCSNYYYTMHRYTGDFVNVQRIIQTTDQELIASSVQWEQEFNAWIDTLNATEAPAAEATKLIPPGALEHLLKLAFSWSLTLLKILGVIILVCLPGRRTKRF